MRKDRLALTMVLGVLGLAAYLNIGWAVGTYFHDMEETQQSNLTLPAQKFLAGPYHSWLDKPEKINTRTPGAQAFGRTITQVVFSVFWPPFIFAIIVIWLAYFFVLVWWWLITSILWLIFAGGIAKLLCAG